MPGIPQKGLWGGRRPGLATYGLERGMIAAQRSCQRGDGGPPTPLSDARRCPQSPASMCCRRESPAVVPTVRQWPPEVPGHCGQGVAGDMDQRPGRDQPGDQGINERQIRHGAHLEPQPGKLSPGDLDHYGRRPMPKASRPESAGAEYPARAAVHVRHGSAAGGVNQRSEQRQHGSDARLSVQCPAQLAGVADCASARRRFRVSVSQLPAPASDTAVRVTPGLRITGYKRFTTLMFIYCARYHRCRPVRGRTDGTGQGWHFMYQ